jgi:hypothetical protein
MSAYATHILIGCAGGLVLARGVELLVPGVLDVAGVGEPTVMRDIGFAAASGFLATWPDIDEPGSFISRRVRMVLALMGGVLFAIAGWMLVAQGWWIDQLPLLPASLEASPYLETAGPAWGRNALGAIVGLFVGLIIGGWSALLLLKGIRSLAGGHRRLTHSLVLGAGLFALAWALWFVLGAGWLALIPLALAWGQLLHVVGDVVTPSGVPLLWPLIETPLRVFPTGTGKTGEMAVALLAVGIMAFLVYV